MSADRSVRFLSFLERVLGLFGPSRVIDPGPRLSAPSIVDDVDKLVPHKLSAVTPEQFDRAMEEYGRLGPDGSIPIEQRWPSVIPDVDRSVYAVLKAQCYDVRWTAANWAEGIRCRRIAQDSDLRKMIAAKYPFLTPRRCSQVETYAWFVTR